MAGEITWDQAKFSLDSNKFTWDDVKLARRAAAGEDWNTWEQKDKKKLIKLVKSYLDFNFPYFRLI